MWRRWILMLMVTGCGSDAHDQTDLSDQSQSITNAMYTRTDVDCLVYVGEYAAQVNDIGRDKAFSSSVTISANGSDCLFSSNSIPNHDFGRKDVSFATAVSEVTESFNIPRNPAAASTDTELSLAYDNAVFLNGVKLDLLAAACYGVGAEPLGQEKIGCHEDKPWRYDPMSPLNQFGTDGHNAHTQPDGAYHYHGDPKAMYDVTGAVASPVLGFAADGFPIYGPFIEGNGVIRRLVSGYVLKTGKRVSQDGEGAFPGGTYDGTFRDDYEFSESTGDLDACNGMTRNGSYGYYVTDSFPWVVGCFRGRPDPSFQKAAGGGGPPDNGGRPLPRRGPGQ